MIQPMTTSEILAAIPQQEPFRFIDEIREVDSDHIVASYRFREDADFYRGHFPGKPVTPGVLLIEALAQTAVVAHGLYLLSKEIPREDLARLISVFTEANVEFSSMVPPGSRVIITGKKIFLRRRKLRSEAVMHLEEGGALVCSGVLAGLGVAR